MSDAKQVEVDQPKGNSSASTLADLKPMGDLSKYAIKDLEADEEEAFFTILKNA